MVGHIVILVTAFVILVSAVPVEAQQAEKVYRIGYLTAGSAKSYKQRVTAFKWGLRTLGYEAGKNVIFDARYAAGRRKQLPALAAELVRLGADVIVTNGATSTRLANKAAKAAGRPIPIVFALLADPVGNGIVASLARPGGNITGLSNANNILVLKRLALLKEVVPSAKRVAVLWSPRTKNGPTQLKALEVLAPKLGLTLIPVALAKAADVDRAFAEIRTARPDGLQVLSWSLINRLRKRLAKNALENKIPTIYGNPRHVAAGGLLSYGANTLDLYRRAATYVDKILKGAKPSELPVERPTKFTLTVNLKTAKVLWITIPQSVLMRSDKVIE